MEKSIQKIVITSGYFNPIHVGHINLLRQAKEIGDYLVVIINNDEQVKLKGGLSFMPQSERAEIIKAIKYVDNVFLSEDKDHSVANSLEIITKQYPNCELFFAKGGDRNADNIPEGEKEVCKKHNIIIINNVGGDKIQSSSWLLNKIARKTDI